MKEEELKQIIAELIHAQGEAIALVVSALCQQIEPAKLRDDLKAHIAAAQATKGTSSLSIRIATAAIAAAEAQAKLQAMRTH